MAKNNLTQPFAPFLPLTVTHNSWQFSTIYDANNNAVCRLDLEDWSVTEHNQDTLEALQEKYAAFIVKACNSHDALVKVLDKILSAEKDFREGMPADWEGDPLTDACKAARKVRAKVLA